MALSWWFLERTLVLVQNERPWAHQDNILQQLDESEKKLVKLQNAVSNTGDIEVEEESVDNDALASLARSIHQAQVHAPEELKEEGQKALEELTKVVEQPSLGRSNQQKPKLTKAERVKQQLRSWILVFLDVTFIQEGRMVKDASIELSDRDLLLSYMDEPLRIAKDYLCSFGIPFSEDEHEQQVLLRVFDTEQVEAIFWRRGAIYYMHSASLNTNHCLQDVSSLDMWIGLNAFQHMLTVYGVFRYPQPQYSQFSMISQTTEADMDTKSLQDKGIFSSTYLLGVMYSAELLFFLHELSFSRDVFNNPNSEAALVSHSTTEQQQLQIEEVHVDVRRPTDLRCIIKTRTDLKSVCLQLILLYITILRTSLSNSGWTAERALDLWRKLEPHSFHHENALIRESLTKKPQETA